MLGPWNHAHEWSWLIMSANGCLWVHESAQEGPWELSNAHECLSCHVHAAHKHSWALMRTHKKQWALRSMAPKSQQRSWLQMSVHEIGAMASLKLIVPWQRTYQCSWVLLGALECLWVFLSDPEHSSSWFSNKQKCWFLIRLLFSVLPISWSKF